MKETTVIPLARSSTEQTSINQGIFGAVRGDPYREMPRIIELGKKHPEYPKTGPVLKSVTIQRSLAYDT